MTPTARFARAALVALLPWFTATPARPACHGRDAFADLEMTAPAALASIRSAAAAMPYGHGRLFRLSRPGLRPSYLFGTLHLSDPRVTRLSPRVEAALRESITLAVEVEDIGDLRDKTALAKDLKGALLARPEQRPDRLLDKAELARLEAALSMRRLSNASAAQVKPTVLALWLDSPPCARKAPGETPEMDLLVADLAQRGGTPTVGLETFREQLEILDELPAADERELLLSSLTQAAHAADGVETTLQRYMASDTGGLLAWMRSAAVVPGVPSARTPGAFLDRLIDARNRRMVERALPLLERGGVFIAVGAAHLPGRAGLANLIAGKNYTLDAIE